MIVTKTMKNVNAIVTGDNDSIISHVFARLQRVVANAGCARTERRGWRAAALPSRNQRFANYVMICATGVCGSLRKERQSLWRNRSRPPRAREVSTVGRSLGPLLRVRCFGSANRSMRFFGNRRGMRGVIHGFYDAVLSALGYRLERRASVALIGTCNRRWVRIRSVL
jgi:hypothetical protein